MHTHTFTHSLTHSHTHSHSHSLTHSLTHTHTQTHSSGDHPLAELRKKKNLANIAAMQEQLTNLEKENVAPQVCVSLPCISQGKRPRTSCAKESL